MNPLEHSGRRAGLAAGVALALLTCVLPAASAAGATVVGVVDGDTVKVRDGGKLRTVHLAGVDAPERGACQGAEAKRGLARLLPTGAKVRSQRDSQAPASHRYLFRGGRLVNAALLRNGYARAADAGDLSQGKSLLAAEQVAKQQSKGIWSCAAPPPPPPPGPPTGGDPPVDAVPRARADLADKMFTKITSGSVLRSSETRLHLCQDGYTALDSFWSSDIVGGSSSSRVEGTWEVVSAQYTATTATARVRLFNQDGETFRNFFAEGQRISIDGVDQTEVGPSDLCAVRRGG